MKQERMKILDLLDEGKITADEAAKLLDVIKSSKDSNDGWFVFDSETSENMEEKFKTFTKNVDSFAREFGGKVQEAYKHMEPKIKKASQTVLEKTASVFDDISRSLNESLENARKNACEAAKCEDENSCECDDTPNEN